jgi:hypothetical protein
MLVFIFFLKLHVEKKDAPKSLADKDTYLQHCGAGD